MNNKYSNFLTILLVLIIIAIVGIIAFLGYKYYETYVTKNEAENFVETYYGDTENNTNTGNNNNNNNTSVIPPTEENNNNNNENMFEGVAEGTNQNGGSSSSSNNKEMYNGFVVSGSIEIPATNLKCPIFDQSEYSPKALETAVVELYGPGLNQVGVTTIVGHNYRNGTFFSNNKKLNVGDRVFITDSTGKRLSYTIYNKYEAAESDTDFMIKDTQGAIEIALQTCTDDVSKRIIILARADV